jgi:hypothetical protein
MRNTIRTLSALLVLGAMASVAVAAETKAVQTMAGIVAGMNHFPSAADKATLTQIVDDKTTTADERTVAKALLNVQHKAAAADKAGLEAIVADAKATAGVKTIAGALLSLNHMASADDKAKLQALSQ